MKVSAKEFSEKFSVNYAIANSVLKFFVQIGVAKESESRTTATGKGRKTKVYDVQDNISFDLIEKSNQSDSDKE